MKRTYVDAGVLIRAARGVESFSAAAVEILCDPAREFVSSVLVKLEAPPGAQNASEAEFYEAYFREVAVWAPPDPHLFATALEEARASGVGPVDAMHIVLAASAGCHELVTAEKPGAPIFLTKRINVIGFG
jgi:predicted nucleic acid-binding protein